MLHESSFLNLVVDGFNNKKTACFTKTANGICECIFHTVLQK
jgi:hypothetical protein